ncbi:MAG: PilZ domain-containing protein [Gammaproteobacteria bacterium]|nr:PilZ domain-containing protein [Rhodocyclaceae bacterium]MBU3910419.1 PilZ domain-containing protein [Gammaproteobacteria bacterium]MBU3990118.1 PilZ domain-containing protein [Gammaproteobacteria bacterium]MBU4004900.1 PilZ domain-containing protein [Gammaproteobacteria bacterium]MBU4020493.1 PilZ domain-containing protein [Gammaproteobacteria bacterium]
MTTQNERRQFWRAHFHSPVQLTVPGQAIKAELLDISLKGALVEVPVEWTGKPGERCQLQLDLAAQEKISMDASVSHIDGHRVGLHCESIDLDSITHLRRLVELNSGNPDLLDRELVTMLHQAA